MVLQGKLLPFEPADLLAKPLALCDQLVVRVAAAPNRGDKLKSDGGLIALDYQIWGHLGNGGACLPGTSLPIVDRPIGSLPVSADAASPQRLQNSERRRVGLRDADFEVVPQCASVDDCNAPLTVHESGGVDYPLGASEVRRRLGQWRRSMHGGNWAIRRASGVPTNIVCPAKPASMRGPVAAIGATRLPCPAFLCAAVSVLALIVHMAQSLAIVRAVAFVNRTVLGVRGIHIFIIPQLTRIDMVTHGN